MIRRILLVLDGSSRAEGAIPYVLAIGEAFRAEVVLLRIVEGRTSSPDEWIDAVEWRLRRGEALDYLEGLKERFAEASIPVDLDVGMGDPASEILATAQARRIDLVVLTSHGCGGASRVRLAGTAHKIIGGARCSVLLVPSVTESVPSGLRRVVVGLDGSRRSEWALHLATILAGSARASLLLVHVVPTPEIPQGPTGEGLRALVDEFVVESRKASKRYLDDLAARLRTPNLELAVRTVATPASVAHTLTRVTAEERDSLLVLSARGATSSDECIYGGVARALVEDPRNPTLVLQDGQRFGSRWDLAPGEARRMGRPEGHSTT